MKDIDRQRLFDAVLAYIVRSGAATPAVCQRLPLESAEFQLLTQAMDEIVVNELAGTPSVLDYYSLRAEATGLRHDLQEIASGCKVGCSDGDEAKRRIINIRIERDAARQQLNERDQQVARLTNALQEIVRDQGRVCEEFETCKHDACRSSYTSWQIAATALKPQVDKKQTEKS